MQDKHVERAIQRRLFGLQGSICPHGDLRHERLAATGGIITTGLNTFSPSPPDGPCLPSKPRLLLVEDESTLRGLLVELLQGDYDLLVAPDGERAWEIAMGTPPPDLVLSDVEMPGLSGIELTRRLRTLPRTAMVPIVLFSANNRLPTLLEGLEVGADDFLLKPFRPLELLARLRSRHRLCEMRREMTAFQHLSG